MGYFKNIIPRIIEGATLEDTIKVVDDHKLGVALIIKPDQTLTGIITDGDIRHFVASGKSINMCNFQLIDGVGY